MVIKTNKLKLVLGVFCALAITIGIACNTNDSSGSGSTEKFLYLASGTAWAGNGVVTANPTNTIVKFDLNGNFKSVVYDMSLIVNDTPVSIIDYDNDNLLVLVENSAARRVMKVRKDGTGAIDFITDTSALSLQLKAILATPDGGWLVSKGTMIEKFSSSRARVLNNGGAYVNAPGGTCATSTTNFPKMVIGPNSSIIAAHAGAAPNNKIIMIKSRGYIAASDCVTAVTASAVPGTWTPSALLYHSNGLLFASYSNVIGSVHAITAYTVDASSITEVGPVFQDTSVLQGISAIAEGPSGEIYATSMVSNFNTIEKFTYSIPDQALNRVGTTPFIQSSVYTRSISSIVVAN